jgi:hypothetical protein
MEDFKRAYREEFGVLVGRSQSPSLFTLRRFLHKVRKLGQGEALIDAFGVGYLRSGLAAWGWKGVPNQDRAMRTRFSRRSDVSKKAFTPSLPPRRRARGL